MRIGDPPTTGAERHAGNAAVEIDGDWHDPNRDARRDAFLGERGISIMRIPVSHIDESLEAVAQRIRSEIELIRQREG